MALREYLAKDWQEFHKVMSTLARSPDRQRSLIFRGQADCTWPLRTTLDRARTFAADEERQEYREHLIDEFRRLAAGLEARPTPARSEAEWEFLGRHHGLPSAILDWTTSPYVAAFFALEAGMANGPTEAAVWMLHRPVFLAERIPQVQLIDGEEAQAFNPRAIEQRAVFMKVDTISKPLEGLLESGLAKIRIPRAERAFALADLDASLVNSRTLFRDLDAAARTAAMRVLPTGAQS